MVGAAGQLLDRWIIDATVYGAERLVFEGAPVVVPPVAQSASKRRPQVHDGVVIDSTAVIADLTDAEARAARRFASGIGDAAQRRGGGGA